MIENFAAEAAGLPQSETPERGFLVHNLRDDVAAEGQGFADRCTIGLYFVGSVGLNDSEHFLKGFDPPLNLLSRPCYIVLASPSIPIP